MPNLLDEMNFKMETYKGSRLYRLLTVIFVLFVLAGIGAGIVINKYFYTEKEISQPEIELAEEQLYEGIITYIDPNLNIQDEISYVLVDKKGEDIILLKAKDQKLEVAEGHFATVYGSKRKTSTKQDYLMVDRIVIKNVAN